MNIKRSFFFTVILLSLGAVLPAQALQFEDRALSDLYVKEVPLRFSTEEMQACLSSIRNSNQGGATQASCTDITHREETEILQVYSNRTVAMNVPSEISDRTTVGGSSCLTTVYQHTVRGSLKFSLIVECSQPTSQANLRRAMRHFFTSWGEQKIRLFFPVPTAEEDEVAKVAHARPLFNLQQCLLSLHHDGNSFSCRMTATPGLSELNRIANLGLVVSRTYALTEHQADQTLTSVKVKYINSGIEMSLSDYDNQYHGVVNDDLRRKFSRMIDAAGGFEVAVILKNSVATTIPVSILRQYERIVHTDLSRCLQGFNGLYREWMGCTVDIEAASVDSDVLYWQQGSQSLSRVYTVDGHIANLHGFAEVVQTSLADGAFHFNEPGNKVNYAVMWDRTPETLSSTGETNEAVMRRLLSLYHEEVTQFRLTFMK